jgi:hypothetical protein
VHGAPAFFPPTHAPSTHVGHGDAAFAVRYAREAWCSMTVAEPVARSTVPVSSLSITSTRQRESAPFATGIGWMK